MATPFIGEIRVFSFGFPPKGWALCNGQLLPINQNQALFSLLGTTYGGNGTTTYALPNLQGRVPIHQGDSFAGNYVLGQLGGAPTVTLTNATTPSHTHTVNANTATSDQITPAGFYWANGGLTSYSDAAGSTMNPNAVTSAGGSQPHENMSPYLTLNFSIALVGIFPSRN